MEDVVFVQSRSTLDIRLKRGCNKTARRLALSNAEPRPPPTVAGQLSPCLRLSFIAFEGSLHMVRPFESTNRAHES